MHRFYRARTRTVKNSVNQVYFDLKLANNKTKNSTVNFMSKFLLRVITLVSLNILKIFSDIIRVQTNQMIILLMLLPSYSCSHHFIVTNTFLFEKKNLNYRV